MQKHSTVTPDVKSRVQAQQQIRWIGDNLGSRSLITITAIEAGKTVYLTLEEALNRIDEFAEAGRNRILSGLAHRFAGMPA